MSITRVPGPLSSRLQAAMLWLERGEPLTARQAAQDALSGAEIGQDRQLEAQALLCLAYCDHACGRQRRAHDTAQRATRLFRLLGNVDGEVESLTLLAQCAVCLGRDEEAVEAALLAVKLGETLPVGPLRAASLNFLGVAYVWAKSFALAEATLREAVTMARQLDSGHAWQPLSSLAWAEVVRLAKSRYLTGAMPSVAELERRSEACMQALAEGAKASLSPGGLKLLAPVVRMTHALTLCWAGHPDKAVAELRRPPEMPDISPAPRLVDVVERWVYTEICWAKGDLSGAEQHARHTIELADLAEDEQLACLAHLVLAQLLEQQGRCDHAMQELRSLRQREMRIRTERVESRHWVVQTALDIRSSEQSLAQMQRYSQELERLSFEDALTNLPNRRRFQAQLESLLGARRSSTHSLCVALIDLDNFKHVNDTYTHAAGDEVLQAFANALRGCVRDQDLPARLAGDEFVVLFPRTTLAEAERVCRRIEDAVSRLRFPQLSPQLQVSVTIGVAEARDDDTPATLLHRSDVAMFANK